MHILANFVLNVVHKSTITNLTMVQIFEVMFDRVD
jgi:hypothetical protein